MKDLPFPDGEDILSLPLALATLTCKRWACSCTFIRQGAAENQTLEKEFCNKVHTETKYLETVDA